LIENTEKMNKVYAGGIKDVMDVSEFAKMDIKELFDKIEKTASKEDIKKFYGEDAWFSANGRKNNQPHSGDWEYRKDEVSPELWRAVYKYSDEYGQFDHSQYDDDDFGPRFAEDDFKILDFGCGPNPIGWGGPSHNLIHTSHCQFHLVELNDFARNKIEERFGMHSRVFIYENLSEVFNSNVKFDIVYSRDVLEHVRYINEHLYVLYLLCKNNGYIYTKFPYDHKSGGHVSGLYEDTKIKDEFKIFIGG